MKVLHVIPSLSPKHGGPSYAMPLIARSLARAGVVVDVATTDDDGPGHRTTVPLGQRVEGEGYGVFYFRKQTEFYKVSLPFRQWLAARMLDYDLVHVHALFSYTSNCAARQARRHGVPYVVRPLGVLNRWGMENRRPFIKRLSFRFVEQSILSHAAAVHYTSRQEQREAEAAGVRARGVVIPLGVDVAQFQRLPDAAVFLKRFPEAAGRPIVLFLSRIDPKKGLDLLLRAWAAIQKGESRKQKVERWVLVVAGGGDAAYAARLQSMAQELGIGDAVLWTGPLVGEEKLSALAAATVFVLPSYSENFGVALVEAMAAGLPCITTDGVAVSEDVRERDAGIVVDVGQRDYGPRTTRPVAGGQWPAGQSDTSPNPLPERGGEGVSGFQNFSVSDFQRNLSQAIERLLGDAALRSRLGANARRLASERFSAEAMGCALTGLYRTVIATKRL